MKPAIVWIAILSFAILAHSEMAHRCSLTIIRKAFDDRKTRPAIGAVGERIMVPAARLVDLIDTFSADGGIRRTGCFYLLVFGGQYGKRSRRGRIDFRDLNGVYFTQGWRRISYGFNKRFTRCTRNTDKHTFPVIPDVSSKTESGCLAPDEGSKPNPLNTTPDTDLQTFGHG